MLEISYNHLNLPISIAFPSSGKIKRGMEYLYDASGAKKKTYNYVGRGVARTDTVDYLGGFQYKNGVLQFFPTSEGYAKAPQLGELPVLSYIYNYTDHLGNVRLSYGDKNRNGSISPVDEIVEENNYYAFGMKHEGYNYNAGDGIYKYKYNGKEFQGQLGLNLYDYGARNYDAAIGRWMNIDPLAETSRRFSPYAYALNNPISFIDPDGMEADDWRIHYKDKQGNSQEFVFNGGHTALPDSQFVRDFVEAYRYDVGNGGGDGLRSVAENPALMIDVQETSEASFTDQPSSFPGSGDYNVVNWNPRMGLETTNGAILSPATVLDHEADHAGKYAAAGKVSMNGRVETRDNKYDNKEEKRVITGSEQRTARANGEVAFGQVTRTDHKGLPVVTTSPTSTKVDAAKTVKYNEKLNSQGLYPTPSADKYKKQ